MLGPHRSGTTVVSQALAESGRFVFLSAADMVARLEGGEEGSAALARLEGARESRAIDVVAVSTTVPEEYGFLLPERHLTEESAPRIAAIHRELAAERGAEKGWLLRNPHDLSHVSRIERHFPGARYVFVVRDPARTINSQLQALRTLFAAPSEYHALWISATGVSRDGPCASRWPGSWSGGGGWSTGCCARSCGRPTAGRGGGAPYPQAAGSSAGTRT